jgi:hypothetical protein
VAMSLGMWAHRWARPKVAFAVAEGVDALRTKPIGLTQTDG